MPAGDYRRIGEAIGRRLGVEVQAADGCELHVNVNCRENIRSDQIWLQIMNGRYVYKIMCRIIIKILDKYALECAFDSNNSSMYIEFSDHMTDSISVKYIWDDICSDKRRLVDE